MIANEMDESMLVELVASASVDALPPVPHLRMLLTILVLLTFTSGISFLIYRMIERDAKKTPAKARGSLPSMSNDDRGQG